MKKRSISLKLIFKTQKLLSNFYKSPHQKINIVFWRWTFNSICWRNKYYSRRYKKAWKLWSSFAKCKIWKITESNSGKIQLGTWEQNIRLSSLYIKLLKTSDWVNQKVKNGKIKWYKTCWIICSFDLKIDIDFYKPFSQLLSKLILENDYSIAKFLYQHIQKKDIRTAYIHCYLNKNYSCWNTLENEHFEAYI